MKEQVFNFKKALEDLKEGENFQCKITKGSLR